MLAKSSALNLLPAIMLLSVPTGIGLLRWSGTITVGHPRAAISGGLPLSYSDETAAAQDANFSGAAGGMQEVFYRK